MGIIQTKKINSAIKQDGLQNVKKAAFFQLAQQYLQLDKIKIKKNIQNQLQDIFLKQLQFIQTKKSYLQQIHSKKQNQLKMQYLELIDKIQLQNQRSYQQLTGYKKTRQKLQIYRQILKKNFREEFARLLKQIDTEVQKVKEKLTQETPFLSSLSRLGKQSREKAFTKYQKDDDFQIQRQEFYRRVLQTYRNSIVQEKLCEDQLKMNKIKCQINDIVQEFEDRLKIYNLQQFGFNKPR